MKAILAAQRKIVIFFFSILVLVTILGSVMYLVEGSDNGFTSIPRSIYWAIVTITTVGYGDISPKSTITRIIILSLQMIIIIMIITFIKNNNN